MRVHRHKTAQRNYERVLLAVHGLADADGVYCYASNAEIAEASGLKPETVKSYLYGMEHQGEILVFSASDGVERRTIVLLDHPKSGRAVGRIVFTHRETTRWGAYA